MVSGGVSETGDDTGCGASEQERVASTTQMRKEEIINAVFIGCMEYTESFLFLTTNIKIGNGNFWEGAL